MKCHLRKLCVTRFFKKKPEIDEDFYEWSVDLAHWITENFGGIEQITKTPLVLST